MLPPILKQTIRPFSLKVPYCESLKHVLCLQWVQNAEVSIRKQHRRERKHREKKLHFVESRSADQAIRTVTVSCSLYLLHANVLDALTIFLKIMTNTSEHRQFFFKHARPCFGFKKPETEMNHEEPSHPYSPTHAASSFLKTATPSLALRDSFLRRTGNPASTTVTFQSIQSISEQADEMRARGAKRAVRVDESLVYLQ